MPILFRSLLREYAKTFTMCFSALMTIYLVIDFFEEEIKGVGSLCLVKLGCAVAGGHAPIPLLEPRYQIRTYGVKMT